MYRISQSQCKTPCIWLVEIISVLCNIKYSLESNKDWQLREKARYWQKYLLKFPLNSTGLILICDNIPFWFSTYMRYNKYKHFKGQFINHRQKALSNPPNLFQIPTRCPKAHLFHWPIKKAFVTHFVSSELGWQKQQFLLLLYPIKSTEEHFLKKNTLFGHRTCLFQWVYSPPD